MSEQPGEFLEDLAFADHLVAADNPEEWRQSAAGLFHAADCCWQRYRAAEGVPLSDLSANDCEKVYDILLGPVAFHLLGAGIETLLKSIAVSERQGLAVNKKSGLYSHDLMAVAKLAKVDLTADEATLLTRIRQWVEWVGRYPIPRLNVKPTSGIEVKDHQDLPGSLTLVHWEQAAAFQRRLHEVIQARTGKG